MYGRESRYAAAVCVVEKGAGCCCATDPARVVGEEGVEPFVAKVGILDAAGTVSQWRFKGNGLENLQEIKLPQDRIVVVGVGEYKLVFELGLGEVLV